MDDALYALDFAMCCGIPTGRVVENRDLKFGEIRLRVDCEVICD